MYVQSAELSLKMVCNFVKTAGRRGTSCSKEEHERRYKVGITLLALFVIVIIGLYLYGASYYTQVAQVDRMITILQERDGEKLAEIVTADDPSVMITREFNASIFIYKRKSILRK